MERLFQYINTVRRPDGTLREYDEYICLSHYERCCDESLYNNFPKEKSLKIKDKERK